MDDMWCINFGSGKLRILRKIRTSFNAFSRQMTLNTFSGDNYRRKNPGQMLGRITLPCTMADLCTYQTWRSLALLGHSPPPTAGEVLLTLGSRLVVVGGYLDKRLCIYTAETRVVGSARDSLAQLQFTAKASQLKFTTEVVDLSRFIRKQGDAAHALAGFSDVWKGEITETGKPVSSSIAPPPGAS
ncbi:hypothetical protein FRC04_003598 [Tulasnella sp. 424]|nr:hypothetical protein FRC04_003598 [Tulasnella sp. 424]